MIYKINMNMLPEVRLSDHVIIEPPYVHRRRKSEEYILYYVQKGSMFLEEDGKCFQLHPGDFCILQPGLTHVGTKPSWCQYYYFHFRQEAIEQIKPSEASSLAGLLCHMRQKAVCSDIYSYEVCKEQSVYLPSHYHIQNYSEQMVVERLLHEAVAFNEIRFENYKILLACKLLEAMIMMGRSYVTAEVFKKLEEQPKSYDKVREVMEYLNHAYAKPLSGSLLEAEFGCNFDYLNRIFKKINGKTIFAYLNEVRMNRAQSMILNTSFNMAQIGREVGYEDEYYFSRVFKKQTGKSPSVYAKEGRR